MRISKTLAIPTAVVAVAALVPAAGVADEAPVGERRADGSVTFSLPAWTAKPGKHRTTVVVRYPSDSPPNAWDGQPVEIQVRQDGSWTTVGQAPQDPVTGRPRSRTKVTYALPLAGPRVKIRAKANSATTSITSATRRLHVESTTPRYNPTALRGSGSYCYAPSIGRNRQQLSYHCWPSAEYELHSWLYDLPADERTFLDRYSGYPQYATGANVVIAEDLVFSGESIDGYRVRRHDLDTGKSHLVAYKRNGKRARKAEDASISANGRRIAYASPSKRIAPHTPKGWNVYVSRAGRKRSRHVGRGDASDITAFGRYVVWRNAKDRIRRMDLRTGRKLSVTKARGHSRGYPQVSAGGRFVTYSQRSKGRRVVRFYDARRDRKRTIGRGRSPVVSDNGRYVAYIGARHRDVYVWDRRTGDSELLSVGPSGNGTGARATGVDISPNGRWVIAGFDGGRKAVNVAPDNGRRYPKDWIVLFDGRN